MKLIDLKFKSLLPTSLKKLVNQLKMDILLKEEEGIETLFQRLDRQIRDIPSRKVTLEGEKAALQAVYDYLTGQPKASLPEACAAVKREKTLEAVNKYLKAHPEVSHREACAVVKRQIEVVDVYLEKHSKASFAEACTAVNSELNPTFLSMTYNLNKIHQVLFRRLQLNQLNTPNKLDEAKLICIHSALHDKDYIFWQKLDWLINKMTVKELESHQQFIHNIVDVNRNFFNTCDPTWEGEGEHSPLLQEYKRELSHLIPIIPRTHFGNNCMEWRKKFNIPLINSAHAAILQQLEDYLVPHYLEVIPLLTLEQAELLQENPKRFLEALNVLTLENTVCKTDNILPATQKKRCDLIKKLPKLKPEEMTKFLATSDKADFYKKFSLKGRHEMLAGSLNTLVEIKSDEASISDFVRPNWIKFIHNEFLKELDVDPNVLSLGVKVFKDFKDSHLHQALSDLKDILLEKMFDFSDHDHTKFNKNVVKLQRLVKVIKELSSDMPTFITSLNPDDWIFLVRHDEQIINYLDYKEIDLAVDTIPQYIQTLAHKKLLNLIDKAYGATYPREKIGFLYKPSKDEKEFKSKAQKCIALPELMQHTTAFLEKKKSTAFTNNLLQNLTKENGKPFIPVKQNNYNDILSKFLDKVQHLMESLKQVLS